MQGHQEKTHEPCSIPPTPGDAECGRFYRANVPDEFHAPNEEQQAGSSDYSVSQAFDPESSAGSQAIGEHVDRNVLTVGQHERRGDEGHPDQCQSRELLTPLKGCVEDISCKHLGSHREDDQHQENARNGLFNQHHPSNPRFDRGWPVGCVLSVGHILNRLFGGFHGISSVDRSWVRRL